MTVKIVSIAHVPEELTKAWMQHLRDFDTAHPGCHFEVVADARDMKMSEIIEAMRVHPDLPIKKIISRE